MVLKKKIELIAVIAILCLSCLLISSVNAQGSTPVNIVSYTGYIDSLGYYHVVGEVQNTGNSALKLVRVTATFYDSSNAVVAVENGYSTLEILSPQVKSPFDALLYDKTQSSKVDHYSLSTSYYTTTTDLPKGLTILSSNTYVDLIGVLHIVGEVQNTGTSTSQYTELVATFYDSNGKVVDGDFTYSSPSDIQAGAKASFDLMFIGSTRVPLAKSYTLIAQSWQYTDTATPTPKVIPISTPTPSPTATSTPIPTAPPTSTPTSTTINTPAPTASSPTSQPTIAPTQAPTPTDANVTPTPIIPEYPMAKPALVLLIATVLISAILHKKTKR